MTASWSIIKKLRVQYPEIDNKALFEMFSGEFQKLSAEHKKADKKHNENAWAEVFALTAEAMLGGGSSRASSGRSYAMPIKKRKLAFFDEQTVDEYDQKTISSIYRNHARKLHPDLNNGSSEAEEKMKELNNEKDWLDTWCASFAKN